VVDLSLNCTEGYKVAYIMGNMKYCEKPDIIQYAVTSAVQYCCEGYHANVEGTKCEPNVDELSNNKTEED
jgi:hypothetical protein